MGKLGKLMGKNMESHCPLRAQASHQKITSGQASQLIGSLSIISYESGLLLQHRVICSILRTKELPFLLCYVNGCAETTLFPNLFRGLRECPAVQPFGFFWSHIHASVTHLAPVVLMPIGTMGGHAGLMEETIPGYAR